ncbi:ATP-binding protein [Methylosinus sp. Ce-a6]|uniref:ATP-binding protein n=1 Tax=Methylosinus sp. Ce-a6 TaxID=2172005 RepID=UPI001359C6F0|nr:ATP-binding protein [Methylosinus sp. Ce-a6]
MRWLAGLSLEFQLAVRLAALYVVATLIGVAALVYQAYQTADSLGDLDLRRRAVDLAALVTLGDDAKPQFSLSSKLAGVYESSADIFLFAIRDPNGQLIAASNSDVRNLVSSWPVASDEPNYFRLEEFGRTEQNYHGLTMRVDSGAGTLSITIARAANVSEFVHTILREFVFDVAWTIPLIVFATLAIGILAIRRGLQPLREISAQAAAINPASLTVRLRQENLPAEIGPLVEAMNHALDRLEKGFSVQRQFTANAAHELRTPLAVVSAGLDQLQGNGELAKLKLDVARMSRLVEQLLRVARLDAIALDVSATVDLAAVAAEVVEYMAPLAVARGVSLAAQGVDHAVFIKGSRYGIEDAIRNLVENGLSHTRAGTEVVVAVDEEAFVSVADRGGGVRVEDRDRIFERFWRARGAGGGGAGLGLAIVKEIMKAHHGSVCVEDNLGGGAVFILQFPKADAFQGSVADDRVKLKR